MPAAAEASAPACEQRDPLRQVFFGDLHVHTAFSTDAYVFGTRAGPDDAYRFARGEEIGLPPLDAQGDPLARVRIDRPLDFAAVTDHAEFIGAVGLCGTPGSPAYDHPGCDAFQAAGAESPPWSDTLGSFGPLIGRIGGGSPSPEVCGEDGAVCREAAAGVWRSTQESAHRFNDGPPGCGFTTFVAYEYSASPELSKVHRNVVFRGESVLPLPISSLDEVEARGLWRRLREECIEAGTGCDVLAIPHNSNLANGRMFALDHREAGDLEQQRDAARLRAELEPLVEMMQIKGDSECRNGLSGVLGSDALCDFEKVRNLPEAPPDCGEGIGRGALMGEGCVSRLDFARYALAEGLREADRIGVNPFKFGLMASTDTHNATPGDVAEWAFDPVGWRSANGPHTNPGGLVAVWAEQNQRDSLFDAMRRRETYGTSGPRHVVRFFGGWEYPDDLCGDPELVARGYAGGVPMGADLPDAPEGLRAPVFVASALADPGTPEHPGGLLQRIQIVKSWADADGVHQSVIDAAGGPNGAGVDLETCRPTGAGEKSLCGVWRDPDFDPERRAVYYARVLENPSCRWTARHCTRTPADQRHAVCENPHLPDTVQERSWSSPIWYAPPRPAGERS
ncbi:MAG: DUF3604 domain-containing protein [Proteobacteria bacterium]|nr:DUF3604 domain-containing protein [Pseudomonadota bacterium]